MMPNKIRKQVYIEPHQEAVLKRLADETGISEAEFIRQAIDLQTQLFQPPKTNLKAWLEEKAFITGLIEQGPVSGRRTWQREDLYGR
ncbi:MAG: CopG family transcriptional regulator [Chloroflexota bacterium]